MMDVVFLPHLRMRSLRWAYKYLTFSRLGQYDPHANRGVS
jgi:hypothetical protein